MIAVYIQNPQNIPIPTPTKNLMIMNSHNVCTKPPASATTLILMTHAKNASLRPNLSDRKPNNILPMIQPANMNILATVARIESSQTRSN